MDSIGKTLIKIRRTKGWTQRIIAQKLDITVPAYSKLERRICDINVTRLFQIADIFDVSVNSIIEDDCTIKGIEAINKLKAEIINYDKEIFFLHKRLNKLYEELRKQQNK